MKIDFYATFLFCCLSVNILFAKGGEKSAHAAKEGSLLAIDLPRLFEKRLAISMWKDEHPENPSGQQQERAPLAELRPDRRHAFTVKKGAAILFATEDLGGIRAYYTDDFEAGEEVRFELLIDKPAAWGRPPGIVPFKVSYVVQTPTDPEKLYEDATIRVLGLYPNPVGGVAYINYKFKTTSVQAAITIRNVLGSEVGVYPMDPLRQLLEIPTEKLREGIYFYTLIVKGESKVTKKFLVKR